MTNTKPAIAVIGAGIGDLPCLRKMGVETTIYEQASAFARIGARIQMTPNAIRCQNGATDMSF